MNAEQHAMFYDEVQADIARLETELTELKAVAQYHHLKAEMAADKVAEKSTKKTGIARVRVGPYVSMKQVEAAESVLRESPEPLRTREIAERLMNGGFPAKDIARLKTSIFTTMTRKTDVFEKAGAGLWKLKEAGE